MLRSTALHAASVGLTIHQAHMRRARDKAQLEGGSGHARSHWTPWPAATTAYSTSQYHCQNNTSASSGTPHSVVQIDHIHISIPSLLLLLPRSNVGPLRESLQIP